MNDAFFLGNRCMRILLRFYNEIIPHIEELHTPTDDHRVIFGSQAEFGTGVCNEKP